MARTVPAREMNALERLLFRVAKFFLFIAAFLFGFWVLALVSFIATMVITGKL